MFGEDPKVGLTSSIIPQDILERLQSEDDLLALNQPLCRHITTFTEN
jgi:hypothetical protein